MAQPCDTELDLQPPFHLTPDQIQQIRSLIDRQDATMASIDREINCLMREVRTLQNKKIEARALALRFNGLISLARRGIPSEILASIFELCVNDGWTRTPLTVSHVCSEWRKAALTPTVWSHVYINSDGRNPFGRTQFWLDRAQTVPLKITLEIRSDVSQLPVILHLLQAHASRWQSLTINSLYVMNVNHVLRLCNRPFALLKDISIFISQDIARQMELGQTQDVSELHPVFQDIAPNLQSIRWACNTLPGRRLLPPHIADLHITLSHLIDERPLPISSILGLLEGLPRLRNFRFTLPYGVEHIFDQEIDTARTVRMLSLEILTLVGSTDLFGVLPHIYSPCLVELHLRSSVDPLGYPHRHTEERILQFVEHCSPPLALLDLRDLDLSHAGFLTCFRTLPHLRQLSLHESEISDDVLQSILGPTSSCPELTKLDLRWCGQLTGQSLVNLIHQRHMKSANNADISRIREVTVINCSFVGDIDILNLAEETVCSVVMHKGNDYCRVLRYLSIREPSV